MPYIVAGGGLDSGIGHAGAMVREISAAGELPQPRNPQLPYRICLVCLGNICRSPMGEVLLRDELRRAGLDGKVEVESAGTGDWHVGEAMDPGARSELSRRGYDGSMHEARQIQASWLHEYDLLLAMDRANLSSLRRMADGDDDLLGRIQLMRSFDPDAPAGAEVPDPYNGRPEDYAEVFELVQAAARGLASQLAAKL
jgi:protein-tyrosine phosphatase